MNQKRRFMLEEALDGFTFDSDAGDGLTIRGYFSELLMTLWIEGEGFSGKRPFGNSCWEFDLLKPLVEHGYIKGSIDADGYIEEVDQPAGNEFVRDLIELAMQEPKL